MVTGFLKITRICASDCGPARSAKPRESTPEVDGLGSASTAASLAGGAGCGAPQPEASRRATGGNDRAKLRFGRTNTSAASRFAVCADASTACVFRPPCRLRKKCVTGCGALRGRHRWRQCRSSAPSASTSRELPAQRGAVTFTDRSGIALGTVLASDASHAVSVPLARISPLFLEAIVAAEDARFARHGAIDFAALAARRPRLCHLRRGAQRRLDDRDAAGAAAAIRHRARCAESSRRSSRAERIAIASSKARSLEAYVNRVPMGGNLYGVEAAARTYFGEPASDLDLAQASLLAAIPNDPARLAPDVDWIALRARQRYVLDRMVETRRDRARAGRRAPSPKRCTCGGTIPESPTPRTRSSSSTHRRPSDGTRAHDDRSGAAAFRRRPRRATSSARSAAFTSPTAPRSSSTIAPATCSPTSARPITSRTRARPQRRRSGAAPTRLVAQAVHLRARARTAARFGRRRFWPTFRPRTRSRAESSTCRPTIADASADRCACATRWPTRSTFRRCTCSRRSASDPCSSDCTSSASRISTQPASYYGLGLTLGSGEVSLVGTRAAYAAIARGGDVVRCTSSPARRRRRRYAREIGQAHVAAGHRYARRSARARKIVRRALGARNAVHGRGEDRYVVGFPRHVDGRFHARLYRRRVGRQLRRQRRCTASRA